MDTGTDAIARPVLRARLYDVVTGKGSAGMSRGELRTDEPMSKHTSLRVGGPARSFYRPADLEDLVRFLRNLPEREPVIWLGLGSNLLVRDGGIDGTVIALQGRLNAIELRGERRVRAEAGVYCAKVARFSARNQLGGGEFFAGIPGTVGGALAMNAGAFGAETWERVVAVETLDRYGEVRVRNPGDFRIGYRSVTGPAGEWFVAAEFALQVARTGAAQDRIRELLRRRNATQPTNQWSCGSVFRNPPGDHAARLIEACGLKGTCYGDACVSDKHANFIVNNGAATAADVEALINQVTERVEKQHGIRLIPEVRIVGEVACP